MRYSKYAILAFLFFSFKLAYTQTVVVTSTEDSGPGTLRAALLNIPTVRAVPYIINFNLSGDPSNDGNRTIRLRSALPSIPSNVTIDGSSQSWPALGVSGAKVIIEPENPNTTFSGLVIGQYLTADVQTTNVEIYGLYLKDFAKISNLQNVNMNQGSGIVLDYRANNIKIGAPGKGNIMSGNINGVLIQNSYYYNNTPLSTINIQSNLIGLNYDGLTAKPNVTGISGNLYDCSLSVGGDNAGEGNVISANQINLNINRNSNSSSGRFEINIVNNKVGTDYRGITDFHELPLFLSSSSIEIAGIKVNAVNTSLYMRNNIISGNRTIGVSIANADFILTGNQIGTGTQGTEALGNGIGIRIESNAAGTIGGATPAEANKIAYNNFGIETTSARAVKITRNSMYCNKTVSIGKTLSILQPYIQVLRKTANHISGKASPNSEVELFYTGNCPELCEGKDYFITVQTGSDGRWKYDGPLSRSVVATASLLGATTSPFSTAELLTNEAIITHVTCAGKGSIKVPEPREGMVFTWNKVLSNGDRIFLGNDQEILNLDEGSYELIIDDHCKAIAHPFFEIKDQKLTDPVVNVPVPACGQTSFTFSATVTRGSGTIRFEWLKAGVIVATGSPVNLPEGTYKLRVRDDAGCIKETADMVIVMKPAPQIVTTGMIILPAACGLTNGSIKGIQIATPTGTVTYQWNVYIPNTSTAGAEVGQALDLENVPGGNYRLTVRDGSACSPVYSYHFIPITNSVFFSGGIVTKATCNTNNGAINNVQITEANTYEWRGPANELLETGRYSPGQALTLKDRAPGTYTLKGSNSVTGCSNTTTFQIDQIPPTQYVLSAQITAATCGADNGTIVLNYTSAFPVRYAWKDAVGNELTGTNRQLNALAPGTYRFFTYDLNGCETVFGPYVIEKTPLLVIEPGTGTAVDDGCSLLRGSVTGVKVNGGILPYSFSWENEAGAVVQSTQDLIGVPAGKYRLILKDNTNCGLAVSDYFTIENPSFVVATPVVNDMRVCYATEIMLPIVAPEAGTYQLYQNEGDAAPVMETKDGRFIFKVSKTADYFIRLKVGSCYSEFRKVHVEVTNDNLDIKNTMTPNADGMNDYWVINGLPDQVNINIKLYTRSGQLVYESIGKYNKPFDGRFRGKDLPAGVYYYKIDLRADCKPLGGSLTLLR